MGMMSWLAEQRIQESMRNGNFEIYLGMASRWSSRIYRVCRKNCGCLLKS